MTFNDGFRDIEEEMDHPLLSDQAMCDLEEMLKTPIALAVICQYADELKANQELKESYGDLLKRRLAELQ